VAYYRHMVAGGEFVIEGNHNWVVSFNGIRIGGRFSSAVEAIKAVEECRAGLLPGPSLRHVASPPTDLSVWDVGGVLRHKRR